MRNEKAVEWLTDSVDLVDEQGAPMDRSLLLEAGGSEEAAAEVADADVVEADGGAADGTDVEAETADVGAVESASSKEG